MRRILIGVLVAVVAGVLATPTSAGATSAQSTTMEFLVLYKAGASPAAARAAIKAAGGTVVRENTAVGLATVRSSASTALVAYERAAGSVQSARGLVDPCRHRQGRVRPRAIDGAGRPLRPELPRLLRRADADPQRVRRRRRRPGARTRSTATATAAATSTTSPTRRRPRLGTCARRARRRLARGASSPTTTTRATSRRSSTSRRSTARRAADARSVAGAAGRRGDGRWLADVPGFPGERCDARIVADVVALTTRVRPAADRLLRRRAARRATASIRSGWRSTSSPADGDWSRTMRLAATLRLVAVVRRDAAAPVAGRSGSSSTTAIRVTAIPRTRATPHLHLSWQHAPADAVHARRRGCAC